MRTLMPILRSRNFFNMPDPKSFNRFWEDLPLANTLREENDFLPSINISETDTEIIVKAEVPGIAKEDMDITLTEGLLTIKGEKKSDHEEKKTENYHRIESRYGSFTRSIRLPVDLKKDEIDATYKDGVLKVVLPKAENIAPKKIEVTRE